MVKVRVVPPPEQPQTVAADEPAVIVLLPRAPNAALMAPQVNPAVPVGDPGKNTVHSGMVVVVHSHEMVIVGPSALQVA